MQTSPRQTALTMSPEAGGDAPEGDVSVWALRLVLMTVLDRRAAALAAGVDPEAALTLWPSSLCAVVAQAAVRSPQAWARCKVLVDGALGQYSSRFDQAPPVELLEHFSEAREVLSGQELAALLWSLIRRSGPLLDAVLSRLGAEVEVIAARRLGGSLAIVHERTAMSVPSGPVATV
jgi:hypothetical protein